MSVPLYKAKAEFFRMLGHPVRIRVLELLGERPRQVRELLAEIDIEASSLSQQLAVLRRAGIVSSVRAGPAVVYELAGPDVADLMRAARRILTEMLSGQAELLDALRDSGLDGAGSAAQDPDADVGLDRAPGGFQDASSAAPAGHGVLDPVAASWS